MKGISKLSILAMLVLVALLFGGCTAVAPAAPAASTAAAEEAATEAAAEEAAAGEKFLIGMSQANKGEPWRQAMNDQIAAAAAQYPELEVVFADAAQNNACLLYTSRGSRRRVPWRGWPLPGREFRSHCRANVLDPYTTGR